MSRPAEVIVVGTGAAGLSAAIAAHDSGATVRILERTDKVGGTTAVSGGGTWIPLHHHMREDMSDSREQALRYARRMTHGRTDDERVVSYIDNAPSVLRYLETATPLDMQLLIMPDYHPEEPGANPQGRVVEARLWDPAVLGEWRPRLRPGHVFGLPATVGEVIEWGALLGPKNLPQDVIAERMERGLLATGGAFTGMLLRGCLDRAIPIELETRARDLILKDGRVTGLHVERGDKPADMPASAVVLACGGFEWNARLCDTFLPGRLTHPNSPPFNEGDALLMALSAGADLDNMTEAWWFPSVVHHNDPYEGRPLSRLCFAERQAPHAILVNRRGRRFVNEAANYNDMAKAFQVFDVNAFDYQNVPAWAIVDSQHRERYMLLNLMPGTDDPDWLDRDETLTGLAKRIRVDPDGLTNEITRFNSFCDEGKDRDYGRGDSFFDRFLGDRTAGHPTLGKIEKPPFYAVPVYPGAMGTKGGPRIDTHGRIQHISGRPIPGLYGAGNAIGCVSGPAYWGGGGTLGPAMVEGVIAGRHAATFA